MGTFGRAVGFLFAVFLFTRVFTFGNASCNAGERKSLIELKESFKDESNRLGSWVGEDCCKWKGVECSNTTDRVIKLDLHNPTSFDYDRFFNDDNYTENYSRTCLGGEISPSLLDLKDLRHLDLSWNNFSGIGIPKFLGSLENLVYLNLSIARFGGNVPHNLGNLSRLVYLDLSDFWTNLLTADSLIWISRISALKVLDMSGVKLTEAKDWLESTNMLRSLQLLNLSNCLVKNVPPLSHVNFSSLASLDLQWNMIDSTVPPFLSNLTGLVKLRLDGNGFHGDISKSLGRLTSLNILGLSSNQFNTSMPISITNMTNLVYLSLSNNKFQGQIPSSIKNLCNLHVFDLAGNQFSGEIPDFGGDPSNCIPNLEHILLSTNSLTGSIPESIGKLLELRELDLSSNRLNGSIPLSLGQLFNLEKLNVLNNSLSGVVSELHFAKLVNLNELSMSFNSLVFNVSSQWLPPFHLQTIKLADCKMGPQFPSWLKSQTQVQMLIMPQASISDALPIWFEEVYSRIHDLDLSDNQITGRVPKFEESNLLYRRLTLKSNKFDGAIPPVPSDVLLFDVSNNSLSGHIPSIQDATNWTLELFILSNNQFTGEIPLFLCQITSLMVIDLAGNQFSGTIPWCIGSLQSLAMLDLTNNTLQGIIPNSLGSLQQLTSLHLRHNRFHGKIPSSLQNLTYLTIMDLGENAFTGFIYPWIGEQLNNLKFLSLQSNNFSGGIPHELCLLQELQLINFAKNNLSGTIPRCLGNLTAMTEDHNAIEYFEGTFVDVSYGANVFAVIKGLERRYTTTIPFLTSIDLSDNNIVGEIPNELTNLFGLTNLNLPGNHLEGQIPEKIGSLKALESLDLSRNSLSGSIPSSLSNLNYLSYLNLSFNKLSGRIPTGNQLQTLNDASIYMGNDALCGKPLLIPCPGDSRQSPSNVPDNVGESGDEDGFDVLMFFAGLGPGFLVGFLGVCGVMVFKESWRDAFFNMVEKLSKAIATMVAWLRRKSHRSN